MPFLVAIFIGILMGLSTYGTFTKLPVRVQRWLSKHVFIVDFLVTISNVLFITGITASAFGIIVAAISEVVSLFMIHRKSRQFIMER